MRQRLLRPACLVSLREVAGLDRIEATNGALRLGALVTHRDGGGRPAAPGAPARPRRDVPPGGHDPHPPHGDGRRRARSRRPEPGSAGDAHGARRPRGESGAPAAGASCRSATFFRDYYETALEPGEVVTAVTVPPLPPASGASFIKFLPRTADDYATVAVAATVTLESGRRALPRGADRARLGWDDPAARAGSGGAAPGRAARRATCSGPPARRPAPRSIR